MEINNTIIILLLLALSYPAAGFAQNSHVSVDSSNAAAFNIYIDCSYCDFDYLRTEISYVNFVRDRKQADVHILVSARETASGGEEYTIEFIGKNRFERMADTLIYYSQESDTESQTRNGLKNRINLGLMRYAARTSAADKISISQAESRGEKEETKDKWNYWVFELSLDSWFNGEQTYRAINI
jgi:hypothetical protein